MKIKTKKVHGNISNKRKSVIAKRKTKDLSKVTVDEFLKHDFEQSSDDNSEENRDISMS